MRVGAYIGTIAQGGSLTGIAADAAHEMAEVLRIRRAPPPASYMTHPARPAAPAQDLAAEAALLGALPLHDGDTVEIRGATLRVIARGAAPHMSRQVAYLQPLDQPLLHAVAPIQPVTAPPAVLEASSALMALIAEEFGIEEAQPHELQPGQATWVSALINDFSLLKAGANFHSVLLPGVARPPGPPQSRGHATNGAPQASAQGFR